MSWLWLATYVLAGFTIGRMAWEFDAYSRDDFSLDVPPTRQEKVLCVITGILWPLVPAWGAWTALRGRKR